MVGYFVPVEFAISATSTMVTSGTSDIVSGSYYPEPVAVRPGRAGVSESARREAREAPRPNRIRQVNSARGGAIRYHELRPP